MAIRNKQGIAPEQDFDDRAPVEDTVTERARARAPAPEPTSGNKSTRWLVAALAVVVIGSAVGFWMLLGATVPNGDLEASEAQLAQTEADLAATRDQAAQDRQTAADRATDLEEELADTVQTFEAEVTGLEGQISGLRADLNATTNDLGASQAEVADLTAGLAAETARAEGAEALVDDATDPLRQTLAMSEFIIALNLWTGSDFVRLTDRYKADVSGYDEVISSLGIAEDWEEWAKSKGMEPLRELDKIMDRIDDPDLQVLFDNWFDCEGNRECAQTYVALDSAMLKALMAEIQATGDALGKQLVGANTI